MPASTFFFQLEIPALYPPHHTGNTPHNDSAYCMHYFTFHWRMIFVFYMGKLLYFQGSRFSLVFLWHLSELNHEAYFSCVFDHCGGSVLQIIILSRPRGRDRDSSREKGEMRPIITMLQSLSILKLPLLFYFQYHKRLFFSFLFRRQPQSTRKGPLS